MQQTIILADDDAMFRHIMRRHLNSFGFKVVEHESGKHVVSQIYDLEPVACIIDIVMAEKEGMETISEIENLPRRPKIIAVSSDSFYLNLAFHLGADTTLRKPITKDQLASALVELDISMMPRVE